MRDLARLGAFAGRLTDDAVHMEFHDFCYAEGWVMPEFDWPEWIGTDEAQPLREAAYLRHHASALQLAQLLTVSMRQARFVDGSLEQDFATGRIQAICERAAELAA